MKSKFNIKKFFATAWEIIKIAVLAIGAFFIYFKIKKFINKIKLVDKIDSDKSIPFKIINNKTIAIDYEGELIGINLPVKVPAHSVDKVYLPVEKTHVEVTSTHEKTNRRINNNIIPNSAFNTLQSK